MNTPFQTAAAAPEDWVPLLDLPSNKVRYALSVGGFFGVFLLIFLPFGVNNYRPDFTLDVAFVLAMLGVGIAVATVLVINHVIMRPLFGPLRRRWHVAGWLCWDFLTIGSVAFVYYNAIGDWHDWFWSSYVRFLPDVALIASLPIAGFALYLRQQWLGLTIVHLVRTGTGAGFSASASAQSSSVQTDTAALAGCDYPASTANGESVPRRVQFQAENSKDLIVVVLEDLLYLEAEDNYVAIVCANDSGNRSVLLRSSLKRIEQQGIDGLIRCHRSFMVNLARVQRCDGNQHGLRLTLRGAQETIPVSRNYVQAVLAVLQPPQS